MAARRTLVISPRHFELLESRVLLSSVVDIDGVQSAALDLPRLYSLLRRSPDTNPILGEDFLGTTYTIPGFLDTGSSGILLSYEAAVGFGINSETFNNQTVQFLDVGVGGVDVFEVSEPLYPSLAPFTPSADIDNPDTFDTTYNQSFGPVRTQITTVPVDPFLSDPINIYGMPLMQGKVMVIDPQLLNETGLDYLKTYLYNPDTAFDPGNADSNPGIPSVNRHVQLSYADFSRFTETLPARAEGPTLDDNPFIGPNPLNALDPNAPVDNTPGITLDHGTFSTTGSFLFDTAAAASFVSQDIAAQLHVHYKEGTYHTDNAELVDDNGDPIAEQFQLPIGGIGGSFTAAGFFIDDLTLPTVEGQGMRFTHAPVLVSDISVEDPITGDSLTLDGDFGMNFLVASLDLSTFEIRSGAFDWITFDQPNGLLGLDLPGAPPITDDIAPTATLTASDLTTAGVDPYTFSVTYADAGGIKTSTLGDDDVLVRLTNDSTLGVTYTGSVSNLDGSVTASYALAAPGGAWDPSDNDTYTVEMQPSSVADESDNPVAAGSLGTFDVNIVATGSISGSVYDDADASGGNNTGDTPLENWQLYIDADDSGSLDTGETVALSGNDGSYQFPDLEPGTYRVREVLQGGYRRTQPAPDDFYDVTVAADADASGNVFGNTQLALLSGNVFNDLDASGNRTGAEPGLIGWSVQFDTDGNASLDTVIPTDAEGNYELAIAAGSYRIVILPPTGWIGTVPTGSEYTGSAAAAQEIGGNDFGFAQTASVSGIVFGDSDRDGNFGGSEVGLSNWQVYLDANSNGRYDRNERTARTNGDGQWSFTGLLAGDYSFGVVPQKHWLQTAPAARSYTVSLSAGQVVTDLNFGEVAHGGPGWKRNFSTTSIALRQGVALDIMSDQLA